MFLSSAHLSVSSGLFYVNAYQSMLRANDSTECNGEVEHNFNNALFKI